MKTLFLTILSLLALPIMAIDEAVLDSLRQLKEVAVQGKRRQVMFRLDRQRIDASQVLTAEGGTAIDVLRQLPGVMVDAEGEVTLRSSSAFLVYIDGKPSPLEGTMALRQIPASSIKQIEWIPTPGARYRTDGDVGIINVLLKGAEQDGWSGYAQTQGSTLGAWGVDAMANYRRSNHTWTMGLTATENKAKSDFQQEKTTHVNNYTTTSHADGTRFDHLRTLIGRVGWQWQHNAHFINTEAQCGQTRAWRGGDMQYDELRLLGNDTINDDTYNSRDRYELRKNLAQVSADYRWQVTPKSTLALNSRLRYDWYSLEYTESNMFSILIGKRYEGTRGYEEEHHWDADAAATFKSQYSRTGTLEAGYQYVTYSEHGGYRFKEWDRAAEVFAEDPRIPFYYRRQTHSLYATVHDRVGRLEWDAGLRLDDVIDLMDIEVKNPDHRHRDLSRLELYPSAHLSYPTEKAGTFSIGYARRTNRPGIWKLEPYITYEDYYTQKIGNPDLRPEYIHSLEAGWRRTLRGDHQVAVNAFYRHRTDVVDVVRVTGKPGVTLDSIINCGVQDDMGLEAQLVLKPFRWWTPTLNGTLLHYRYAADYEGCTDARGVTYQLAWDNAFVVTPSTHVQLTARFIGPNRLTQGHERAYGFADLAIRQDFWQGRLTLSLVAHDVFRTAKYYSKRTASSPALSSETWIRPTYPNIHLTLAYRFRSKKGEQKATSSDALFIGRDF